MNDYLVGWWLAFLPLLAVPPIYLLRRWGLGVWLATLTAAGGGWLVFRLPAAGEEVRLLGRAFHFGEVWPYAMAILFGTTAILFVLSGQVSQGWTFYPFGLLIATLLGGAMATRHLGLAALAMEVAALFAVFIIQGGRPGSVRGSLRFLVMMTLAVPLFLLAAWQSEQIRGGGGDSPLALQVTLLAAGGFAVWLAVAPAHGWLTAVAAEARPGISAFVFVAFPTTATVILLHLLGESPWLLDVPHARQVLLLAGLFSAVLGGGFAAAQTAFGPLMGYATLFDLGAALAALGLGTQAGLQMVLYALPVRALALALVGAAGAVVESEAGDDSFARAQGLGRRWPLAAAGLMVGGATLAGAPLTAGFVSRWLLLQALNALDARWPVLVLLGSLGVAVGYLRGLKALLGPSLPRPEPPRQWVLNLLLGGLSLACVGIGLFPQPVLDTIKGLVAMLRIPVL